MTLGVGTGATIGGTAGSIMIGFAAGTLGSGTGAGAVEGEGMSAIGLGVSVVASFNLFNREAAPSVELPAVPGATTAFSGNAGRLCFSADWQPTATRSERPTHQIPFCILNPSLGERA
jgi:hypothetical protein